MGGPAGGQRWAEDRGSRSWHNLRQFEWNRCKNMQENHWSVEMWINVDFFDLDLLVSSFWDCFEGQVFDLERDLSCPGAAWTFLRALAGPEGRRWLIGGRSDERTISNPIELDDVSLAFRKGQKTTWLTPEQSRVWEELEGFLGGEDGQARNGRKSLVAQDVSWKEASYLTKQKEKDVASFQRWRLWHLVWPFFDSAVLWRSVPMMP